MGDGRLSTETAADVLDGTELMEVTQAGNTRVTTAQEIADLAGDSNGLFGSGGFTAVSSQSDQATVAASTGTLYVVTTGATNATCTVNLPSPTEAGQVIGVFYLAENATDDSVVIHPAASDNINNSTADFVLGDTQQYAEFVSNGDGVNWYVNGYSGAQVFAQATTPGTAYAYGSIWVKTS